MSSPPVVAIASYPPITAPRRDDADKIIDDDYDDINNDDYDDDYDDINNDDNNDDNADDGNVNDDDDVDSEDNDDDDDADDDGGEEDNAQSPVKNSKKAKSRPARTSDRNLMMTLMALLGTGADVDIRKMLSHPAAWDCLGRPTQQHILSLLPEGTPTTTAPNDAAPRPDPAALLNNDSFRADAVAYLSNLVAGRHTAEWLITALDASEDRALGLHDAYEAERFAREWGVKLPPEMRRGARQ